ncbi:MAG: helix-turn-helix domain-containing protein [Candidatus Gastranaerophilaceae bacterium]
MIYDDKKFIGEVIKKARKKAKMTQAELSEKIDMSEKNLGNIENGKQFPQINNFFRILEVLNISIEDFGVQTKAKDNNLRENILQNIYLLDNSQIEIYSKFIEFMTKLTYKKS